MDQAPQTIDSIRFLAIADRLRRSVRRRVVATDDVPARKRGRAFDKGVLLGSDLVRPRDGSVHSPDNAGLLWKESGR